jgi:hypothetical protein
MMSLAVVPRKKMLCSGIGFLLSQFQHKEIDRPGDAGGLVSLGVCYSIFLFTKCYVKLLYIIV